MQIKLSKRAFNNLETLYNLVYVDKPTVAVEFKNSLIDFINLLKTNPYMGRDCKQRGIQKDCRVLVYKKNYIIIYKVHENHIMIQTIKNTKKG